MFFQMIVGTVLPNGPHAFVKRTVKDDGPYFPIPQEFLYTFKPIMDKRMGYVIISVEICV